VQLLAIGPDLSIVHSADTFGQKADAFGSAEYPFCTGAKRIDHQVVIPARFSP
jgi:hypothetical protein